MAPKTIGYYIPESMTEKLRWTELIALLEARGFRTVKVNLRKPLIQQRSFDIFIHKLTDVFAAELTGDMEARGLLLRLEKQLAVRPNVLVLSPLKNVRKLANRYETYSLLKVCGLKTVNVHVPGFALLNSMITSYNSAALKKGGVRFPIMCKPLAGNEHGSQEMTIMFNDNGLGLVEPPCVAQTFVKHNAIVYKVLVVGNEYQVIRNASVKNYSPDRGNADQDFQPKTGPKPGSSTANATFFEKALKGPQMDPEKIKRIVAIIRKTFGVNMFGVDVVVHPTTGFHVILDVNYFPSYEGYTNFSASVLRYIEQVAKGKFGR